MAGPPPGLPELLAEITVGENHLMLGGLQEDIGGQVIQELKEAVPLGLHGALGLAQGGDVLPHHDDLRRPAGRIPHQIGVPQHQPFAAVPPQKGHLQLPQGLAGRHPGQQLPGHFLLGRRHQQGQGILGEDLLPSPAA